MPLATEQKKKLRGIGHGLHPIVTVAGKGLSPSVMAEAGRALQDHELVKVRLTIDDRAERKRIGAQLCKELGAELVQEIGKLILIYRHNPKASPQLSNLHRVSARKP